MHPGATEAALRAEDIWKSFPSGEERLEVLRGVDLVVEPGQLVAITGASGSGKSTLLHILGGLEKPDKGRVWYGPKEIGRLDEDNRTRLRNEYVGFVFQSQQLLPEFTARENVAIPLLLAGLGVRSAMARAEELLALVGLSGRASHRPAQLSGGEQQRVAVARAMANHPRLILADEPTGNLDRPTGEALFDLIYSLARSQGQSWVVATHDEYLALRADIRWRLVGGRLESPVDTSLH